MTVADRLQHAWNAFTNKDPTYRYFGNITGHRSSYRPDRLRLTGGKEKSIITSVYNRLAVDAASITIEHVELDDNNRYIGSINSGLNNCLTLSANTDQTARALLQDAITSMFDEGCVALVPIETNIDPKFTSGFDILSLRTGRIVEWFPQSVKVEVYNEWSGQKEEIMCLKKSIAIIENPFYMVMNEYNSTMQRLIRKLNLLDVIDEQSGAGKLDLIIQLPYIIKSEARRNQAERRRKDIVEQLAGSKYGIAYTDGTERITQLNRPIENNLMKQIEFLTSMLYSQLGLTAEIMDGSADEKTMNNYYSRTIEPILSALVDEMKRKFLSKTARTRKQTIAFFRDPFKLVPTNELAELVDKFTRNEVITGNEARQIVGLKPSSDPNADALRNKNVSPSKDLVQYDVDGNIIHEGENNEENLKGGNQNEV